MHAPSLWLKALRAGLVSYLGVTLAVTTVAAAYWAAHSEFPGHEHPAGTPDHVHQLQEVGLSGTLALVFTALATTLPVAPRLQGSVAPWSRARARNRMNCARAPPSQRVPRRL